jgi:hypothetical protein
MGHSDGRKVHVLLLAVNALKYTHITYYKVIIRGCIQKFPDWPPGARTAKWYSSLPLGAVVSLFCVSRVSFAVITLCVVSQRVLL